MRINSKEMLVNSIGLVMELHRKGKQKDGLLWYCDECNHKLHETYFPLINIETDFLPRFKKFYQSIKLRTCSKCKTIMDSDERFV